MKFKLFGFIVILACFMLYYFLLCYPFPHYLIIHQGSPQKKMTARRKIGWLKVKWVAKGDPGESMRGGYPSHWGGVGGLPLDIFKKPKVLWWILTAFDRQN